MFLYSMVQQRMNRLRFTHVTKAIIPTPQRQEYVRRTQRGAGLLLIVR
jgi:hypothetical protein